MKEMFRIVRRYSLTAGFIILIILVSNGCVLAGIGYMTAGQEGVSRYTQISMRLMEQIAEEFVQEGEAYSLSENGRKLLEESEFVWAMALDEAGCVVWKWKLPEGFPEQYSIQDTAAFARWYLEDYPVKVLISGNLLLVFGCDPDMISRYQLFIASPIMKNLPDYFRLFIIINLLIIGVFILCFGYKFYLSMRPIAQGIEALAEQKPVKLKEKGLSGGLAGKLNAASELLLAQAQALERRDMARTEWIAGVSHDIRTPLSLILGNSDRLAKDESLSLENRMLAENIRRQSLIIRKLIQDLNLTSKLAYQAQPLKLGRCQPAALLRSCAADFYNEGLEAWQEGKYEIELVIEEELEQIQIEADEDLLARALRNLLGNSIRHNPEGCLIRASLKKEGGRLKFLIEDTGPGIPERVVRNMEDPETGVHIMGLRLTDQIARAHGGELKFVQREEGGHDALLVI